jgi:hypothetical protein
VEDAILQLVSAEGNSALKERFSAVAPAAAKRLTTDGWFPLPSKRVAEGQWHTVIASVLYFLVEDALGFEGDNLPAGVIQGYFLQAVIAAVPISMASVTGGEDELLLAVGNALADAAVKPVQAAPVVVSPAVPVTPAPVAVTPVEPAVPAEPTPAVIPAPATEPAA